MIENCLQFDPVRKHLKSDTNETGLDDGLDRQVNALPYSLTKRFGEIVFAQGGTGYGWWPCQIYDPRLAIDPNVRQTAQKHLHSRFLVYFFNCTDINMDSNAKGGTISSATNSTNNSNLNQANTSATGTATPFSILAPKMIKSWVVGLSEDLYFGRAAKNHGKQRYRSFRDAFQLACIEYDKSINNTFIDQQHRFILNEYVYPKTGMNDAMSTSIISPTPEKKFRQESFLLPSPPKRVVSNKIQQKGIKKKRGQEKIDWIRLQCPSRKQRRPTSTTIHHSSTFACEKNDDDGTPHPAFADCTFPSNTIWRNLPASNNTGDTIDQQVAAPYFSESMTIPSLYDVPLMCDGDKELLPSVSKDIIDDRHSKTVVTGRPQTTVANSSLLALTKSLPQRSKSGRSKKINQSTSIDVAQKQQPSLDQSHPPNHPNSSALLTATLLSSSEPSQYKASSHQKRGRPIKIDQSQHADLLLPDSHIKKAQGRPQRKRNHNQRK